MGAVEDEAKGVGSASACEPMSVDSEGGLGIQNTRFRCARHPTQPHHLLGTTIERAMPAPA